MQYSAQFHLLLLSLRARWKSYLWVIAGMAVGMLALGLSVVAGLGLGRSLEQYLSDIFPENRVLLRPKTMNMLWLQVETAVISPETVEKARALPGVKRLSPEATLRFPVSAEGSLLGNTYRTDISVTGIEPWLLGDDAPADFTYDFSKGGEVPCILARYFLDLYNMTLAESNKLPKLSEQAAIGRKFTLYLGASSLRPVNFDRPDTKFKAVDSKIVALSRNPNLLGLIIPLEAVEAMNEWYGVGRREYRGLHVELENPAALDAIREQLPALGLELVDSTATWRRAVTFIQLVGLGFVGFGALVFALSLGYMSSSVEWMLARRRRERGLFHALGATGARIVGLVGAEVALVSGLGVGLGFAGCAAGFRWINAWYQTWRQDRAFLPEQLFAIPWTWLWGLAAACWLVAMGLALRAILRDARRPVIDILSRGE
jgi:hypothetical protein